MFEITPRKAIAAAVAGTLAVAIPTAIGATTDGGSPANKAVAAGSKGVEMGPGTTQTVLSATFKTSKPTDLLLSLSAECSILTTTTIAGSTVAGTTQTAEAEGRIRMWLELDGKIIAIEDASTPPQDPAAATPGNDTDKVTFCDRLQRRTVQDTEEDEDGIDRSVDYQRTKSANAFNWVRLNAGSGVHTLLVKAEFTTNQINGAAEAVLGNRTLIIEPTKMANNAVIAENGTSTSGS